MNRPIRIVLSSAPLSAEEQYGKYAAARSEDPSFGLLLLAAVAEDAGAEVLLIDASAETLTVEQTLAEVLAFRPDIVGLSSTSPGIVPTSVLAEQLCKHLPDVLTVVGGAHVSAVPRETMDIFPQFHMAVIGEGEDVLRDILTAFKSGQGLRGIAGTVARNEDGSLKFNPPRAHLVDLDKLPLPAWHLLRGFPEKFRPSPDRYRRLPYASLILSRGCPNNCAFCDQTVFGHRRRAYGLDYVMRMIRVLVEKYHVRELSLLDSTFIATRKQTQEFCERLIAEKFDLTWMCHGRSNQADLELFKLMRRAGCWMVAFGIESGDQRILDAMRKRQTPEKVAQAVNYAKQAGLRVKGFFILGFPGETKETMENTRRFALSLPIDIMHVFLFSPFPGTAILKESDLHKLGQFDYDWKRLNAFSPVFVPNGLTFKDLYNMQDTMFRQFYFRFRVIFSHLSLAVRNVRLALHMFKGFVSLCGGLLQRRQ